MFLIIFAVYIYFYYHSFSGLEFLSLKTFQHITENVLTVSWATKHLTFFDIAGIYTIYQLLLFGTLMIAWVWALISDKNTEED